MIDSKNVLEVITEVLEVITETVVIPVAIITFVLLMCIVIYLWKKDPDIVRSRIFLNYCKFKRAFLLFAVFAFILILHVSLIVIPVYFNDVNLIKETGYLIKYVQRFFGLTLALIMITFVFYLYRSMK